FAILRASRAADGAPQKNPPLATGSSLGETPGRVTRFAIALCVANHTREKKLSEHQAARLSGQDLRNSLNFKSSQIGAERGFGNTSSLGERLQFGSKAHVRLITARSQVQILSPRPN